MRRRLFNLAAAVSLVLCLGTAALWVRSCWRADAFSFWTASGLRELRTQNGKLALDNEPQRALDRLPLELVYKERLSIEATIKPLLRQLSDAESEWQKSPDRFNKGAAEGAAARAANLRIKLDDPEQQLFLLHARLITLVVRKPLAISPPISHSVPLYLPLILASLLPSAWIVSAHLRWRMNREHQRMKGCRTCGYNLIGNTASAPNAAPRSRGRQRRRREAEAVQFGRRCVAPAVHRIGCHLADRAGANDR